MVDCREQINACHVVDMASGSKAKYFGNASVLSALYDECTFST